MVSSMVFVDVLLVRSNSTCVHHNSVLQLMDIEAKIGHRSFERFKSDKQLSLDLDSFFIVILVPNLLRLIEIINLTVEVSTWELFSIGLIVVCVLVVGSNAKTFSIW